MRTVGDGVATFVGWSGGAGRMVKIKHLSGYETWYNHLNGFASGIRSGTKVSQGQVIGYVGSSGLSTVITSYSIHYTKLYEKAFFKIVRLIASQCIAVWIYVGKNPIKSIFNNH